MRKKILALQVFFFLFPLSAFSQTISYTLSMPEPWTHYYHVTQTIKGERKKSIDFVMPVWIPGSYKVREFSKNVEEFKAHSEKSDYLKWEKIDKNSWRVYTNKANEKYQKYRAVNLLFHDIIKRAIERDFKFLDFGIFTVDMEPNWGLGRFKESFGASGLFRDVMELDL